MRQFAEHWSPSYSKMLDRLIQENIRMQTGEPSEFIDRVESTCAALGMFDETRLRGLLAVAIDRLAIGGQS